MNQENCVEITLRSGEITFPWKLSPVLQNVLPPLFSPISELHTLKVIVPLTLLYSFLLSHAQVPLQPLLGPQFLFFADPRDLANSQAVGRSRDCCSNAPC